ncbi:hypothetical protein A3F08_03665 [Candidatus Berkelbacteria bacterium RIFCSPHIGHO2_12_FULL_36_9]|uniref:Uncharacterized protein n=1 Tax=Candidatus Berkelbacteria bacterium RIFCSPHIGHO2_12_FULL_36_9 TaxID=1797469 RepID=A0A1F5EHW4_9BACT|nr:MAG: hypothetical protein A3F08_03665 [Candidatus Berkelbacteria bacterium RIFCSPHIGHO2_12_FULL_36_9]
MKQYFLNFIEKIKQIADSYSLLTATSPYNSRLLLVLTIIFSVFLIAGILTWMTMKSVASQKPPFQELRARLTTFLATIGGIGLVLTFFEWQTIPYLSSRLLILILIVIFLFWSYNFLRYIQRGFSWELAESERQERYKKYLPRSKLAGLPRVKLKNLDSKKRRKK